MTPLLLPEVDSGTAIYIFCIIPNRIHNNPGVTTFMNLTFAIDGELAGTYQHQPDTTETVAFNFAVYANESLRNAPHSIVISPTAGPIRDSTNSLILFDYAIYT
jgi:hypothetical protein